MALFLGAQSLLLFPYALLLQLLYSRIMKIMPCISKNINTVQSIFPEFKLERGLQAWIESKDKYTIHNN